MTNEEARAWLEHHFDPLPDGTKQSEALSLAIKALEQEPKWLPVGERLPEIDVPVLIFQRYYFGVNITIGRYHSDEEQGGYRYWQWIKYDNHFSYGIDHFGIICPDSYYVDAWMPLPKPYEPQESEG